MLRNDLITQLSQTDNDPVVVAVNGAFVDVDMVTTDQGRVILALDPEEIAAAFSNPSPGPPLAPSSSDEVPPATNTDS